MAKRRIEPSTSSEVPNHRRGSRPGVRFSASRARRAAERSVNPAELDDEVFYHSKARSLELQLKEQRGAISPPEKDDLVVLQAKMDDFWAQRSARASRLGHRLSEAVLQRAPGSSVRQGSSSRAQPTVAPSLSPVPMPTSLRGGLEQLSGLDLSAVRVHRSSPEPGQLGALAYTQGQDIMVGPGQEHHLPHEGWHVVQQMQGRVDATGPTTGLSINEDAALEREADAMGSRASRARRSPHGPLKRPARRTRSFGVIQLKGVGGTKIAFERRRQQQQQQAIDQGMVLLKAAWKEARRSRRAIKDRVSRDMAAYDKAVKESDQETINRLERENDRRNRPQLYQAQDQADVALQNLLAQINTLKSQLFHATESMGIFGAQYHLEDLGNVQQVPDQGRLIGQAMRRIMQNQQLIQLNQQAGVLRGLKAQADLNLQQDIQLRPKSGGLTQVYFDSVASQIPDEEELLQQTPSFRNGVLSLANGEITYHHQDGQVIIADLRTGRNIYAPSQDQPSPRQVRQVFHKKGLDDLTTRDGGRKEYVEDSRGTKTRRYAYVEKNYYQMMEFFMVGHMTGRFQQYMLSGGERKPGVHKFTTKMIENVPLAQPNQQSRLTDTQVAVAHQMYGSLPEQRGVSLTSTPKVGVTYANTSGNFRTDDGFKLKIDLARVPDEVLFLNHYAQRGVSSMNPPDYSTLQSHKENPYNYKYEESAGHARELFLEFIRPEWVVEIEHHVRGGFQGVQGAKAILREGSVENLLDAAKRAFGGREYEKGFEVGLQAGQDEPRLKANPDYKKGKGTGAMVREGYGKGVEVRKQKGHGDASVAFKEIMEEPAIQDKMSPYHVGYAQGRTGQPMVSSVAEFRMLLNTEMELQDVTGVGGTTALTHDANNLIIKRSIPLQMGGFTNKIVTIPFEELRDARLEVEEEDGAVEMTLKKRSGDYTLLLSSSQAMPLIRTLQGYIDQNFRQLTTSDVEGGGSHALYLDPENLKIERQYKSYLGVYKLNKYEIPLQSINKVEFEWEGDTIQVIIHHRGTTYEMSLEPAEALEVRGLLRRNGLGAEIVRQIPEKE